MHSRADCRKNDVGVGFFLFAQEWEKRQKARRHKHPADDTDVTLFTERHSSSQRTPKKNFSPLDVARNIYELDDDDDVDEYDDVTRATSSTTPDSRGVDEPIIK